MSDPNVIDSGTSNAPVADPTPSAPSVPTTPGTFAQPATPAPTEDRSNWVPPHRLRETRESTQRELNTQFAQREAQYQAQLQQVQSQLHALVGVQPPQNPEVDAIKAQFSKLYPGISRLEERADQLQALIERSGDLESQNQHYWQSYGRQNMDRLFSLASETFGGPITDDAKRSLHSAFVGAIQNNPEMAERYANDPTVVNDFWKAFSSNFIDPVRRSASAAVVGRANAGMNLPQDTPSGAPRVGAQPGPQSMDERANAAWAMFEQSKRQ